MDAIRRKALTSRVGCTQTCNMQQEKLMPNNVNVRLVLSRSRSAFHQWTSGPSQNLMYTSRGPSWRHARSRSHPSSSSAWKSSWSLQGPKPASPCGYQALQSSRGVSTADVDALFNGKIPAMVIVGLVSNEAFVGAWQKYHFNFAHTDLNSACLVVDGRPLPAQPWQPNFEWGLYAKTYHALLKSSDMYPSNWSNGFFAEQFVGGNMLLGCPGTWHLMTAMLWLTYPPDVWARWKPVWDLPCPCRWPPHR